MVKNTLYSKYEMIFSYEGVKLFSHYNIQIDFPIENILHNLFKINKIEKIKKFFNRI